MKESLTLLRWQSCKETGNNVIRADYTDDIHKPEISFATILLYTLSKAIQNMDLLGKSAVEMDGKEIFIPIAKKGYSLCVLIVFLCVSVHWFMFVSVTLIMKCLCVHLIRRILLPKDIHPYRCTLCVFIVFLCVSVSLCCVCIKHRLVSMHAH